MVEDIIMSLHSNLEPVCAQLDEIKPHVSVDVWDYQICCLACEL